MMRWIVGSSLRLRFLVIAAAVTMLGFGVVDLRNSPVDVFPEFAPPRVEVQTPSLGLSAAEVEELVTVPLEQSLTGIPDLDIIRSKSVRELSSIQLIFKNGTDQLRARQLVQERIATVTPSLPTWASPPFMIQPLSATSRAMKIAMSSEQVSMIEMSSIAYWTIRQRLLKVPGVANVAIWGERLQQTHVLVDPNRLRSEGVTVQRIMDVTAGALDAGLLRFSEGSVIGTGGWLETPNQRFPIRLTQAITTPEDLAAVPVLKRGDRTLRLGDIAQVVEGHQPLPGDAVINDGEGLMLIVEKFPWGNTLDVTRGVEQAIDELRPGLPGIEIDTTLFRPATFIETALENLTIALLIGCLLVILVLISFLFEWRTAFISLVAIPLSLVAAGLVLSVRGETINTMILAGLVIAVGVVVDDAIIDIENIWRRLRQRAQEGGRLSTARVVLEASLEVRRPIVYATLITVLAVAPVFFLQGLSGSFFQPLAFSYVLAVLASMVVALTVTPAMALILLSRAPLERPDPALARWLKAHYSTVLARVIKSPRPVYAAVVLIVAGGIAVLPMLGQSLLPDFKERDFLMHWVTKPGTSVGEETRISVRACQELRQVPGVRNCGSHIGQGLLMDEVVGANFGENWISVSPDVDYDMTHAQVVEVVNGYPGLRRDVQTYLRERIKEVVAGSSGAIVVRIFGQDLDVLREQADEVEQEISGISGISELDVELHEPIPQVDVQVDLAAAQRYGVKPGDVRRATSVLVSSEEVGDLFHSGKAYDVHVWSAPQFRQSLTDIRNLLIDIPGGGHVRLDDVADVSIKPTPNIIEREAVSRKIDVFANVSGRDLGSVAAEVDNRIDEIDFPVGYHAEMLGEAEEQESARDSLFGYGALAFGGILLLLIAAFGSWRLASLFFLSLPIALVGGVLAAQLSGGIISIGSLVGFLTVFGIAARNGILLINHYQHLEREEGEPFGPGLVIRGARERLSPILMTALATGLAILPLVVAGDLPGHEIEHPMAVVIVGGLLTSTLFSLLVIPSLYLRFGRRGGAPAEEPPAEPVSEAGGV
ncbi:CzcA family heavy metal efflux pump [Kribbella orskensis]|uniref:CzcA family heavy metal efflux pump n=1 Tax=Kribbella orskensis TaxID=2512216 RepID=A0ABY2BIM6_9ACTN|nr:MULTISPECIES: efflux RND transporter permease subunit [Kribbella]TCN37656.1 CzcA family heavy metal efflux pump [Kribbella sp. VKM Ac-2500]TCO18842.1 CzcA family heavy metal efflux pump [Kribbella orskensis]